MGRAAARRAKVDGVHTDIFAGNIVVGNEQFFWTETGYSATIYYEASIMDFVAVDTVIFNKYGNIHHWPNGASYQENNAYLSSPPTNACVAHNDCRNFNILGANPFIHYNPGFRLVPNNAPAPKTCADTDSCDSNGNDVTVTATPATVGAPYPSPLGSYSLSNVGGVTSAFMYPSNYDRDSALCKIDEENLVAAQENYVAAYIVAFASIGAVVLAAGETAGWALIFLDAAGIAAAIAVDGATHALNAAQLTYQHDHC